MKIFTHRRFKVVGLAIALLAGVTAFVWLLVNAEWFPIAINAFIAFGLALIVANTCFPGDPKEPKPPEKTYDNVSRD